MCCISDLYCGYIREINRERKINERKQTMVEKAKRETHAGEGGTELEKSKSM